MVVTFFITVTSIPNEEELQKALQVLQFAFMAYKIAFILQNYLAAYQKTDLKQLPFVSLRPIFSP